MKYSDTHLKGVLHLPRAEFDTLEKAERVLYVVDEEDGFSLYLGEKALLNGALHLFARLEQLQQTLDQLASQNLTIRQRLGLLQYPFPDVDGDGVVTATDAQLLSEFSAKLGAGEYAEYGTPEEKWNAFAAEKGLENSHFILDANGDGKVDASDSADMLGYASEAGAGNYPNSAEGFRDYMLDTDNAIFGATISGLRAVSAEQYENLKKSESVKSGILYIIPDE